MRAKERAMTTSPPSVARLHGRVLARRSFAVVRVADEAPTDPFLTQVFGDLRQRPDGSVEGVPAFTGQAGEGVHDAQEKVVGDEFEVSAVVEPRAGGRYLVGRALAPSLHQDRERLVVPSVPRREGGQELQSSRRRRNTDRDPGIGRRRKTLRRPDEARLCA